MSRSLFWLSDDAWAPLEPHLPKNQPGARRVDDRRVISGIIHMLTGTSQCLMIAAARIRIAGNTNMSTFSVSLVRGN